MKARATGTGHRAGRKQGWREAALPNCSRSVSGEGRVARLGLHANATPRAWGRTQLVLDEHEQT